MPQTQRDRVVRLREFIPIVDQKDWTLETPEQPVQIIQKSTGTREFGTEVVTSPDGSIAAILAASPGASTSVSIIVEVLNKCFPNEMHTTQ